MTVTLIRALLIYFTVILAMRIMGKRQIGELNPHELVITILVSQIASIPLQDNTMPLANAFLPMLLLVSLEILASVASMKSLRLRNLLQGRPIFLIRHGKPDQKQMRRLRFTVDDLIDALRQKDVFDLSTVEEAVVETNGSLSVRLRTEESPVTPKTVGRTDAGQRLSHTRSHRRPHCAGIFRRPSAGHSSHCQGAAKGEPAPR